MLHRFRVGAHNQESVARDMSKGGPHLLRIHDPLVTVAHCLARQPGKVRSRAWLREQLTPHFFAGKERPQVPTLLFVATPLDHRWAAHAVANRVAKVWVRATGASHSLVDDLLIFGRKPEPTMAFRKVHPRQAHVELSAEKRHGVGGLGRTRGQQLFDQVDDVLFVRRFRNCCAQGLGGHDSEGSRCATFVTSCFQEKSPRQPQTALPSSCREAARH